MQLLGWVHHCDLGILVRASRLNKGNLKTLSVSNEKPQRNIFRSLCRRGKVMLGLDYEVPVHDWMNWPAADKFIAPSELLVGLITLRTHLQRFTILLLS